jgi:hypothetical protein
VRDILEILAVLAATIIAALVAVAPWAAAMYFLSGR